MKRSKQISVEKAISSYYERNKTKLNKIFGSERSAKAHLRNDVVDLPESHFNSKSHATEVFNNYVEEVSDPEGYELKKAKREALENTPGVYNKIQELNKKIDKYGYTNWSKSLGVSDGRSSSVVGYYDIKEKDTIDPTEKKNVVLAKIRYQVGENTEYFAWEFLDRNLL